jgi:hypothetical protein
MIRSIDVPVAVGELIDKITILQIKAERIRDAAKVANVRLELDLLLDRRNAALGEDTKIEVLAARLKAINEKLWDLEDDIRDCERREAFGAAFVALARRIYATNDERAAIKREINLASGSAIVEEKSYTSYGNEASGS